MLIEKRARLDVKELVLVTRENLQEVADWCGGIVDGDTFSFTDTTGGSSVDMIAFIGDYIETREDGFSCWSGGMITKIYNRNEKGELLEN